VTYKIKPLAKAYGSFKTGTLVDLSKVEIEFMLGFKPNTKDDPTKVDMCWTFEVEGRPHSIWSYKNSFLIGTWSVHGTDQLFELVFGDHYVPGHRVLDTKTLAP
jgi:hypothetical protein